jgi:hypothetical protein
VVRGEEHVPVGKGREESEGREGNTAQKEKATKPWGSKASRPSLASRPSNYNVLICWRAGAHHVGAIRNTRGNAEEKLLTR